MGTYRPARNFEISTKDYIKTNMVSDWSNVNVYRGWGNVSGNNLPAVTVRSGINVHDRVELGSFNTRRSITLFIDIFATSEGQGLDLTDYLVGLLKKSWDYEKYTVTNGVSTSETDGKITCINISDTPVNLNTNKSELDKIDRYRYLLTLVVVNNKVEV